MNNDPVATRPPSGSEKLLKEKFAESIANQSAQMDKLAQQLITLELAIPGLYATVLKLVSGDKATLKASPALTFSFVCWLLALGLTLISLFPKKWTVNRSIMKQHAVQDTQELGIEDFFYKTARYKCKFLICACIFFFAGVCLAVISVF